jgi:hypothetical protein
MLFKAISFLLITLIASAVATIIYLWFFTRGTAATSIDLLRGLTIYSPIYWLILFLLWGVLWWLFRGWFRTA